ncbi:Translation elongation factor Ts [Liberibacter crescens BT-1]|uniref:Elongation factor Ts n=1 Tax=Liberibacter crescens (strain BT-1) TaxID=1215343 RepID=L0ERD8_LIBCB|nr:translation elongation factor Ts [Liberibacter crescens]AGA64034.1 Translation elongation factor Ts [Liberibacter crescens BT-1]
MGSVSTEKIKLLRNQTGAGMMDCKKALSETGGDIPLSVNWLRAKGLSRAGKKSHRETTEGLVGVALGDSRASIIEMNSETDYVARNDKFQDLVLRVASVALSTDGSVENIISATCDDLGVSVEEEIRSNIATIGENIILRRSAILSVDEGVVVSYVHGAVAECLGKRAVLVALKSSGDKDVLRAIGVKVAMHVAACSPLAIHSQDIDPAIINNEREIFIEEAQKSSNSSKELILKIVEGKLQKFLRESSLLSQKFVMDSDITVSDFLKKSEESIGAHVDVVGMVYFVLGEGLSNI